MNRCEGRPSAPCPDLRKDKTVRNTIYDLFLCPACETYRENQKPLAPTPIPAESVPDLNTKSAGETTSMKSIRNTRNRKVDNSISSKILAESVVGNQPLNNNESISDLKKQINDLELINKEQNVIINTVVCRLNFLLSMFNIDELSLPSPNPDYAKQWPILPSHTSLNLETDLNAIANDGCGVQPFPSHSQPSSIQSLSSAVGRTAQPLVKQQFSKICQSMVAAVYVDQREKERRACSFIVSGLPTSTEHSDKVMVTDLCAGEFSFQVDVISTKRLGKLDVSSTPKIQPLLVTLKDADQAKCIISSARQLRRSSISSVRDNVFINANLTKAEASAAYELRCRHREVIARRTTITAGHSDVRTTTTHASTLHSAAAGRSSAEASDKIVSDVIAALNVDVPPFVPSSLSSGIS